MERFRVYGLGVGEGFCKGSLSIFGKFRFHDGLFEPTIPYFPIRTLVRVNSGTFMKCVEPLGVLNFAEKTALDTCVERLLSYKIPVMRVCCRAYPKP